jgi:hypothetical protein
LYGDYHRRLFFDDTAFEWSPKTQMGVNQAKIEGKME